MMHNMKLHRLFGHEKMKNIIMLQQMGLCDGVKVLEDGEIPFCGTCMHTRGRRPKTKKKTLNRASMRGQRVFTDLKEVEVRSTGGHKWAIHFVDDATRYRKSYYLKSKADAWLALRKYVQDECDPLGIKLQCIRHDGGTEFGRRGVVYHETSKWRTYVKSQPQGQVISIERAPAYTPEMVGVVERYNQTMWNLVRSILHDQQRPKSLWPWAARFAEKIINTMPTRALGNDTSPYIEWKEMIPDTVRWQVPLSDAYAYNEKEKKQSLEDRRHRYIYVGESSESPSYLLLSLATGSIIERRYEAVIFQDDTDARDMETPKTITTGGVEFDKTLRSFG